MTLVEFLRARLDEDERTIKEVEGVDWYVVQPPHVLQPATENWHLVFDADRKVANVGFANGGVMRPAEAAHIVRHSPASVLRDIEAKRRIIAEFERESEGGQGRDGLWLALHILAAVYAGHPDYREEWRV